MPESPHPRNVPYNAPRLVRYGSISKLTQGGGSLGVEGLSGMLGMNGGGGGLMLPPIGMMM